LIRDIRKLAAEKGLVPYAGDTRKDGLRIRAHPLVHANHPTYGYSIEAEGRHVMWAPEFIEFPS